jgi:nucleotide-binding universal stress UspA family protein
MNRILVGVDDSPAAQSALAWSAQLATRGDLELVVARVFVSSQAELPPDEDALLHDQQLAELDQWCGALGAETLGASTLLLDGDPHVELLSAAHGHHADMLVVGGGDAVRHSHVPLSSVAHHLAHHTTIPLAIVPAGIAAAPEHVVLGVNGSRGSLVAAEFCAELASRLGMTVTAVYAFEPFVADWVGSNSRSWQRQAETDARTWAAPVEKAGLRLDVDVDRDIHPVAAMTRALSPQRGSVAVVGSHSHGGLIDPHFGSVPLRLLHDTDAAVIVVPTSIGATRDA